MLKPVPSLFMANTVPLPGTPPLEVVPYNVLPDWVKAPSGQAPSLLEKGDETVVGVKAYKLVKFAPLVLTANTVPLPEPPPPTVVPYNVSPDNTKAADG